MLVPLAKGQGGTYDKATNSRLDSAALDLKVLPDGIPDKAFEPRAGDDKDIARELLRRNREERRRQTDLFTGNIGDALTEMTRHSHEIDDIADIRRFSQLTEAHRFFTLDKNDFWLLNPNTGNGPIFRSQADAELTKAIYRRVPILWREATDNQPEVNTKTYAAVGESYNRTSKTWGYCVYAIGD